MFHLSHSQHLWEPHHSLLGAVLLRLRHVPCLGKRFQTLLPLVWQHQEPTPPMPAQVFSLSSSALLSLDAFVSLTSAADNLEVQAAHLPEPQGVHVPSLAESVHGCKLSWYIFCRLYGRSLFSSISGNYIPPNGKNIEQSPHAGSPQGAFCSQPCGHKYYTWSFYKTYFFVCDLKWSASNS